MVRTLIRMSQRIRLEQFAFHEAGHAVVAHNQGFELDCVHVSDDGGHTHYVESSEYQLRKFDAIDGRKRWLKILLAGINAQLIWQKQLDEEAKQEFDQDESLKFDHGSQGDYTTALSTLSRIAALRPDAPQVTMEECIAESKQIVEATWPQVTQLARELIKRRAIHQERLMRIIESAK
jgi:hypothetical protein